MHGVGTWVLTYQSLMKSFAWALPKVAKVLVPGVNAAAGESASSTRQFGWRESALSGRGRPSGWTL